MRVEARLFGLLFALFLVFAVVYGFWTWGDGGRVEVIGTTALVLSAAAPDPFVRRRAEEIVPEHDKGEDPDLVDTLRLSATWSQGAVTLALLNDRICRAGEVIGRVQIDSVSIDGVWPEPGAPADAASARIAAEFPAAAASSKRTSSVVTASSGGFCRAYAGGASKASARRARRTIDDSIIDPARRRGATYRQPPASHR